MYFIFFLFLVFLGVIGVLGTGLVWGVIGILVLFFIESGVFC